MQRAVVAERVNRAALGGEVLQDPPERFGPRLLSRERIDVVGHPRDVFCIHDRCCLSPSAPGDPVVEVAKCYQYAKEALTA